MSATDTIFALSSGALPAGVAVVRVSGGDAFNALRALTDSHPEPRVLTLASIRRRDGSLLDTGMVCRFPSPRSFTGEDCVEFHVHGGPAVVAALLDDLSGISGLRHAEAGEFMLRAFRNGKLDLTEAEGLADLIEGGTEAQRRLAIEQSRGGLRKLYGSWRDRLLEGRALIEASIDFSDEADVASSLSTAAEPDLSALAGEIADHVASFGNAEMVRDGFRVVIVGAPNAGKSSLLNWFAGRDAAIVSDEAGTTRDLVDVHLDLGGYLVTLTDTAGLRSAVSKVEAEGIRRATDRARQSDLVLSLAEPTGAHVDLADAGPVWRIRTKADTSSGSIDSVDGDRWISIVDATGLAELKADLARHVRDRIGSLSELMPTRARHVELLRKTVAEIEAGLACRPDAMELRAEHVRLAADALGRITGEIGVEEVLGAIFSRFCIGK